MTEAVAAEGREAMVIRYGHERLEFEVRRTNHRPHTVRIHLDPTLGVWVSAPPHAEAKAIRAAVRRRARWVYQYLEGRNRNPEQARVISGEQVLYLGRRYMLKVLDEQPVGVKLRGCRLEVRCPGRDPDRIQALRSRWYRDHASEYLQKRLVALFNPDLHGRNDVPAFSLRKMRRQWGSCSPSGQILFNPALIRAPRECVDYVVAHELCHLSHHHHGNSFFDCLTRTLPDWEEGQSRLDLFTPLILEQSV